MTLNELQDKCVATEPKYLTRGDEALFGLLGLQTATGKIFNLYNNSLYKGVELSQEAWTEALGEVICNIAILAHVADVGLASVCRELGERLNSEQCEPKQDVGDKES